MHNHRALPVAQTSCNASHKRRNGQWPGNKCCRKETIGIINEEEVEQVSQERQARRLQVEVKQVEEVDEVEASRAAPPTRDKAVAATPLITTWTTTVALITFPNQPSQNFFCL